MTRTFVDAGVLIAGSRQVGPIGDAARAVLIDAGRVFLSSVFVRLEVLPKAVWTRRSDEADFYEAYFERVVAWASPFDRLVVEAEREASLHGLAAMDALHVAAAMLLGADEFVTTERPRKPIHRVQGVRVVPI